MQASARLAVRNIGVVIDHCSRRASPPRGLAGSFRCRIVPLALAFDST